MNSKNRFSQSSKYSYQQTIKLNSNEVPAVVNLETGEVLTCTPKRSYKSSTRIAMQGEEEWIVKTPHNKFYIKNWEWLKKQTTDEELFVAFKLCMLVEEYTNSLRPLSDSTVTEELSRIIRCNKNNIKPILYKLYQLGVYGRFDVCDPEKPFTKYWIFSPYLNFMGNIIDSEMARLFSTTRIARAFRNEKVDMKLEEYVKKTKISKQ
jgi:hypothetical protein